jgi:predicted O-methyltransferase YrrM
MNTPLPYGCLVNTDENSASTSVELIKPTDNENDVLNRLDDAYIKIAEMSYEEKAFLNCMILRNQPKKLLELGVSSGGSSIVMLNAIKDIPNAELFSVDYSENYFRDDTLKTGYFVDNYSELKNKWKLFTGSLALNYMEEIGKDIDFCLIDTMHINPGEILDFLMVLPYLKKDAIVVFHDVNFHTMKYPNYEWGMTNNLLVSAISGKKYIQGNFIRKGPNNPYFPNIAGIKINEETYNHIFEIFNILTIKWTYFPTETDWMEIIHHFERYYDSYYINYLKDVFAFQKICYEKDTTLKMVIKRTWMAIKKCLKKVLKK